MGGVAREDSGEKGAILSEEMHTATEGSVSDEALAARAQAGEREALDQLFGRHRPWIFNLAVRMLGNRTDAEDATQDILLRVLRSLETFRGESRFRTWLYRVASNHLLISEGRSGSPRRRSVRLREPPRDSKRSPISTHRTRALCPFR